MAAMSVPAYATYPSLRDRAVLITGGATGIGAGLVEAFAQQHARTAFLDIDGEAAAALVGNAEARRLPRPIYIHCDLTSLDQLHSAIADVTKQLGGVDVLINNAGNDTRHTLDEATPELWDRLMAINLRQQFFAARAVAPAMKQAERGSIINMSSISWIIPSTGLPVYVTAKAAIVGMTRTLARELGAANIRVNAILPGAILTERQQRLWLTDEYRAHIMASQSLKRHLYPDDVARLALFLAADDSSGITGQSHIIDAGWV
jgi:NAD(P)-dependent dehydrogenase (short-subunit alcohol dehydrogenase family)